MKILKAGTLEIMVGNSDFFHTEGGYLTYIKDSGGNIYRLVNEHQKVICEMKNIPLVVNLVPSKDSAEVEKRVGTWVPFSFVGSPYGYTTSLVSIK